MLNTKNRMFHTKVKLTLFKKVHDAQKFNELGPIEWLKFLTSMYGPIVSKLSVNLSLTTYTALLSVVKVTWQEM